MDRDRPPGRRNRAARPRLRFRPARLRDGTTTLTIVSAAHGPATGHTASGIAMSRSGAEAGGAGRDPGAGPGAGSASPGAGAGPDPGNVSPGRGNAGPADTATVTGNADTVTGNAGPADAGTAPGNAGPDPGNATPDPGNAGAADTGTAASSSDRSPEPAPSPAGRRPEPPSSPADRSPGPAPRSGPRPRKPPRTVVPLEIAASYRARTRGLLGRDGIDGALLLTPANSVHTFRMRFPIDVAHLDRDLRVIAVRTMRPGRLGALRLRARHVLEAEAGAMERWGLLPGTRVEIG